MAVISVSIIESSEQVVSGIPKTVTLQSNIAATIFYTLDGLTPTLDSFIYTGPLSMPRDKVKVVLKFFATNGFDSSPIYTEEYFSTFADNSRLPHSGTTNTNNDKKTDYPFGSNPTQPDAVFLNPGDSGVTVDDPSIPGYASGYDGDGYQTGFTDLPYNRENYNIVYSDRNSTGEYGKNIGNMPAHVKIDNPPPPPEYSEVYKNMFDPRAMVIFQDAQNEDLSTPPVINRQFFTSGDQSKIRDGNQYYTPALDSQPFTGSFVRSSYNPRDNTVTYYYRDNNTNQWIISKTPYNPNGSFDGNLTGIFSNRNPGSKYVYEWIPFKRRVLF
jgi:hypothetical protein